jgi:hypothetical protein
MLEAQEENLHEANVKSLVREHGNIIDPEIIIEVYLETFSRHEKAPVRQFIPLLVMKEAKKALSQKYLNVEGL